MPHPTGGPMSPSRGWCMQRSLIIPRYFDPRHPPTACPAEVVVERLARARARRGVTNRLLAKLQGVFGHKGRNPVAARVALRGRSPRTHRDFEPLGSV